MPTSAIKSCKETKAIITVEDHYPQGGLGSVVAQTLSEEKNKIPLYIMAVTKPPQSGKPQELLNYEDISAKAIVKKVKEII